MKITIFGAAQEVTGSCYLIQTGDEKVLLDCGLIQGRREDEKRNWADFPFSVDEIDAVVLSHAHIDHSGRLPMLVAKGYQGPIYTHNASKALCEIMLLDSGYLHEKDAEWENKRRSKRGQAPVAPLYTADDAAQCIPFFKGLEYDETIEILPNLNLRLSDAGHILGAAIVELWCNDGGQSTKIVFSGDLGHSSAPVMDDPTAISNTDLLVMESTYGDRLHRSHEDTIKEIGEVFDAAKKANGNILIPAFSVGRTQDLLYLLGKHYDEWGLEHWQVFLDSPMAIRATETYARFKNLYSSQLFTDKGTVKSLPNLSLTRTSEESMAINKITSGAIIIAGSGMCTGGRIRHHLKNNVSNAGAHIVIVGFQAYGTLGRKLVDGASTIKLWGDDYDVKASVHTVGGLSAHADQAGLMKWYGQFDNTPPVWLVHGESKAQDTLAKALKEKYSARVIIPQRGDSFSVSTVEKAHADAN